MRFQWPVVFGEQKQTISFNQLLERLAAGHKVFSGISVTPETAMKCTTVQGIVRALTNAIGSYPVSVAQVATREGKRVIEERQDHTLMRLFERPNAVQTSTEFFRMAMTHIALYGNFYALKGQGQTGPISYLRPIEDPSAVSLDDVKSVEWAKGVTYRVAFDEPRFVPQTKMLHITSGIPSADGITGISPVEKAKEAIGICLAAERLIAELYGNSNVPSLVLSGGMFRDEEDYELWRKKFKEAQSTGDTLLLPEGMKPEDTSFSPTDAQLLEMRKFQRIEIAQVYGVPPHKLADLERATFSNIEEQSLEFVRDVAKPYVKLFQQAMGRDLLTDIDRRAGYVVRFDMEEATEGKLADRMAAYRIAHEIGALSPNEIRKRIGENPRTDPGGDEYVTPLNMRTSNELPSNPENQEPGGEDPELVSEESSNPIRAVR